MIKQFSRRGFVGTVAGAAAAVATTNWTTHAVAAEPQQSDREQPDPRRRLKVAIVGCGNRGWAHVREVHAIESAEIVALCDVDVNYLVAAARHVPDAKVFVDFRDMLKMPEIEAVLVCTPDHTHAVIAAAAMRAGKHVYVEKPLAHTMAETRLLTDLAAEKKLVTQLGIQIHAQDNYRRVVEIIRSGAIGPVREVQIWHDRVLRDLDYTEAPPPATLNYDLWLGPATQRPYRPNYHPFSWRRWSAFGTGLAGDIGCHFMDIAFWALDLRHPTRIAATGADTPEELTAQWIVATFDFPARGEMPAVKLTWSDPPKQPPGRESWDLAPDVKEGVMFIGDDGMLFTHYRRHVLLPKEKFADFTPPPQTIPSSPGHQREWVEACLKNDPSATSAPFSYGGPLSEAALLSVVAHRAGKPLDWDAAAMKFPNAPDANRLLTKPYRPGWEL